MKCYAHFGAAPGPFITQQVPIQRKGEPDYFRNETGYMVLINARWRRVLKDKLGTGDEFVKVDNQKVRLSIMSDSCAKSMQ